jgi:large repetitive protein
MKFKFVSDRPASAFECKLDEARWRPCASPTTVRGLAPGKHVFRVRAMDAAGNRGPADRVIWRVVAAK